MKRVLLAIIVTCLSAGPMLAGTKMIYATGGGEPFATTGFVVGYEGGNCIPPKFAYELESTDHRSNVWLCAVGRNEFALRQAMISHGLYNVAGTWQEGAERPYVEVTSVRWY